jgi:transposase-like protein
MKRRNWSADEKLAIVLEGIKEKRSVSEICQEHQISQGLYYRWRDKFLDGGKKALINNYKDTNIYDTEIDKLQKIIGKQTIQIEILKKTAELFGTK